MAKQDYYSTLGVAKDADLETLKKAYRKLAMQYHPDRNHGDAAAEQKFKELSEAYDVLKDDQKRAAYDRFGHAAFENGNGRAGPGGAGFDFTASGFADIFDEMFGEFMGGRRGSQSRARGSDLRYNMEITLEEAFAGTRRPSACRAPSPARRAMAPAAKKAPSRPPVPPAAATARCARPRAFSPSSAPAPAAAASAR
jgi:molecular chaperone DnaJ